MRRLVILLALLILVLNTIPIAVAQTDENAPTEHNYIVVIDNSGSTTGDHSLGSATDPQGLRFDAARAVYKTILKLGGSGQFGAIVFSGPENCELIIPRQMNGNQAFLDENIGNKLTFDAALRWIMRCA